MMEEGEDRIRATYRDNYDRLAAIKAKYDPDNFFRVNQNIRPHSDALLDAVVTVEHGLQSKAVTIG
jgi:hypothetical protein